MSDHLNINERVETESTNTQNSFEIKREPH